MGKREKASLLYDESDLPERVRENLRTVVPIGTFVLAVLTKYRPNGDMPFAWLVLRGGALVLCGSHRTRGVYAAHPFTDINEVRLEGAGKILRILLNGPDLADLVVPLSPTLTSDEARALVQAMKSVGQ